MKAIKTIITVALVGLTLITTSNVAFARGWGRNGDRGGYDHPGSRQGQVMFAEMQKARIQAIAELTDQSEATITAKLQNKPVWAVLDEYGAKFTDFQDKMSAKRTELINQAVADGTITQQQADRMIERESQRSKGFAQGNGRGRGFRGDCPMY